MIAKILKDEELKYCPDCKKFVEISNFYKNRSRKDGLGTHCKKHAYKRKKESEFRKVMREHGKQI
jgi:hypothetical protein